MIIQEAIQIIKDAESFESKPYLCSSDVATIGYGTTIYPDGRAVQLTDPSITMVKALEFFEHDVNKAENDIIHYIKKPLNPNQMGAVVSLVYNIGIGNFRKSTLLKKLNIDPNDKAIYDCFLVWNLSKGKISNGLIKRRKKEATLYFKQ